MKNILKKEREDMYLAIMDIYKEDREVIDLLEYKEISRFVKAAVILVQLSDEEFLLENVAYFLLGEYGLVESDIDEVLIPSKDEIIKDFGIKENELEDAINIYYKEFGLLQDSIENLLVDLEIYLSM